MKRNRVGQRWRAVFAGYDGNLYDAICTERKRGVRVDYFVRLRDGDRLVTAALDRHEAKARLARVAP